MKLMYYRVRTMLWANFSKCSICEAMKGTEERKVQPFSHAQFYWYVFS